MRLLFFIGLFLFLGVISWLWATSIGKMKEEHPDYKGEDFLSEENQNSVI